MRRFPARTMARGGIPRHTTIPKARHDLQQPSYACYVLGVLSTTPALEVKCFNFHVG